jgi:tRNA pseudouridine32 synthase/23S rRNA pseudouridine746 synthase
VESEASERESSAVYLVPHSKEPARILYRDRYLLLVRKPHLLLSVPGRHPLNRDCLISRLQRDEPNARIVHRLDLDTSGLMVIALGAAAQSTLGRLFQQRKVRKEYTAVVWGELAQAHGTIELPIASDWARRPRQKICMHSGKSAITHYHVLARAAGRTRLLLRPVTGRSHQLRIHLAAIGHPILGCDFYAHERALQAAPRLLLHASRIGLPHPGSGEWLDLEDPPDF